MLFRLSGFLPIGVALLIVFGRDVRELPPIDYATITDRVHSCVPEFAARSMGPFVDLDAMIAARVGEGLVEEVYQRASTHRRSRWPRGFLFSLS